MSNILYVIAVLLTISWAIGFLAFGIGGLLHTLLIIAVIAFLLRIIQGRRIL